MEVATSSNIESNDTIDVQLEQYGEYKQDILIDKRKLKQIQKEGFSIATYDGF
jgi:hypothetical protein